MNRRLCLSEQCTLIHATKPLCAAAAHSEEAREAELQQCCHFLHYIAIGSNYGYE